MSILKDRPTFGVAGPVVPAQQKEERKESGAIWKFMTKANKPMYNVKINLPKEKLLEIISKAEGNDVQLVFVGFENEYNNGDLKRPIIRMYEDRNK